MKTLLQRRNKKYEDLKTSISSLSVVKKVEQSHQEKEDNEAVREYKTCRNLSLNDDSLPSQQNCKVLKMTSIPESTDSQFLKSPLKKGFEYNFTENAFEEIYEVKQKLGEGAHGVVRRCIHRENGKVFAVKILKMEDQHYRSLKTNFINIRQLKHSNIIKYRALYLNPKMRLCHLVMEYTPLQPLRYGMDQNSLRFVFYKLLDALTYIHEKGICHRDIKPPNILYDIDQGVLKLIDFGVSKNMRLRGRYQQMLTNTGTCQYKAPEMFSGGSYSQKIDSWAVGIALYQLIAGYTPFEEEYHSDTINNIISKDLHFDQKHFGKFSSLAKDLIIRLLKKDPKERMTCEEARRHLWFVPHLNDIDLMQSAGFGISTISKSEQSLEGSIGFTWLMPRRSSVNDLESVGSQKVSKGQKDNTKRWLSIINQNENHNHQDYKIDFVQSCSDVSGESDNQQRHFRNQPDLTSLREIKLQDKDSIATI